VCDASVVAAWYLRQPCSERAAALQRAEAALLAPRLLHLECANAFLREQRREPDLPPGFTAQAVAALRRAPIILTEDAELLDGAVLLAQQLRHPVYDCVYLHLARRSEAALATFDQALARHAAALAIPLWEPAAA
jgi:predicted nucleic acid-binding protein